jgi:hypothetical protein
MLSSINIIASWVESDLGDTGLRVGTTFETAIDFVLDLEAREAEAFGLRPDPVAKWNPSEFEVKHWGEITKNEPLIGPSSQLVDPKRYTEWSDADER